MNDNALVEKYVAGAWLKIRLTEEESEVLARRELEEVEKREKEAKSRGEVKGQMKMFKDDGTAAEGGAVTTRRMEAV